MAHNSPTARPDRRSARARQDRPGPAARQVDAAGRSARASRNWRRPAARLAASAVALAILAATAGRSASPAPPGQPSDARTSDAGISDARTSAAQPPAARDCAVAAGLAARAALAPGDAWYPRRDSPRLTTPQWVGRDGIEAVVVVSIDDLRETARMEPFLRPIVARLKKIEGRAPVSLFANRVEPSDPKLREWLADGVSIEAHTLDHPCPCLAGGDLPSSRRTYEAGAELVGSIPGAAPIAFRMPCCDSMNSPSPRFFVEVMANARGKAAAIRLDSSVMHVFTADDPALPRQLVLDRDGSERFRKYVPEDRDFGNYIENYPYPYPVAPGFWELPVSAPSDWAAQHRNGRCSPASVDDWKAAIDLTVAKQGVFVTCFHPHGWISVEQVVELIDHVESRHARRVAFLSMRDVAERLEKLGWPPLCGRMPVAPAPPAPGAPEVSASGGSDSRDPAPLGGDDSSGTAAPGSDDSPVAARSGADGRRTVRVDLDGDGRPETLRPEDLPEAAWFVDAEGHDAGLRLVDLDADGRLDLVFSNAERYLVALCEPGARGFRVVRHARRGRGEPAGEIPPIVRADRTNNGAWFAHGRMWVQNEDTGGRVIGQVLSIGYADLLGLSRDPPQRDDGSPDDRAAAVP